MRRCGPPCNTRSPACRHSVVRHKGHAWPQQRAEQEGRQARGGHPRWRAGQKGGRSRRCMAGAGPAPAPAGRAGQHIAGWRAAPSPSTWPAPPPGTCSARRWSGSVPNLEAREGMHATLPWARCFDAHAQPNRRPLSAAAPARGAPLSALHATTSSCMHTGAATRPRICPLRSATSKQRARSLALASGRRHKQAGATRHVSHPAWLPVSPPNLQSRAATMRVLVRPRTLLSTLRQLRARRGAGGPRERPQV